MSKAVFMRIVLVLGSVLILIGVTLVGWMLANNDEENVIRVVLEEGESQTVKFEALRLVPGSECEYTVRLKKSGSKKYDLKLDFIETEEKTLKNFARVKILSGDEVLYDDLLATAFENDRLFIDVDFNEKQNTELVIVYYLPLEVGNEAKNAEAVFELLLSASIDE